MAKVIFGNHSSVIVPVQDRESIRRFYCDVLGGTLTKAQPERDFVRLGEDFYIAFLYGDVPDESEFLRSARAVWLSGIPKVLFVTRWQPGAGPGGGGGQHLVR